MPEPSKFDDDWAELARELEHDKPSSPPSPANFNPPAESAPEPAGVVDGSSEGGDEPLDEYEDDGPGGDSEPSGESAPGDTHPGTGRKRRRRRRRRRKGSGQPAEAGSEETEVEKSGAADGDTESSGHDRLPVLVPPYQESTPAESEYSDEPADDTMEEIESFTPEVSEEDAGGELLRELIANWNVPSWDEVVSGLYRP